jgi:YebC/PmpR family DNA-binding regulatory protein
MRAAQRRETFEWQQKPSVTSDMSARGRDVLAAGDLESPGEQGSHRLSGHSKWATTKHKKAVVDARRGKLFAKLIKNVEVAARTGGGDPAGNPTLADAIAKAKGNSVPNDNIDRAVRRGAGLDAGGADYESIMYEGYGPGGVAVLVECLTDNRNRAASEVRTAFTRNGGSLADPGSVSYLFTRKGVVLVPKAGESGELTEDDLLGAVLDAGAEEVNDLGETFEVISEATDAHAVRVALEDAGIAVESADVSFLPSVSVPLDDETGRKVLRLVDALEDSDDVQNVWANFDVSDEVLESV